MTYLVIADWDRVFENNRSRQVDDLTWLRMPNKHDGETFHELMEHDQGEAHYGCWALVTQIASKCRPRGVLVKKSGKPHTPESLAKLVGAKEKVMAAAIKRFIEIGWVKRQVGDVRDGRWVTLGTSGGRQAGAPVSDTELVTDLPNKSVTKKPQKPRRSKRRLGSATPPEPKCHHCHKDKSKCDHDLDYAEKIVREALEAANGSPESFWDQDERLDQFVAGLTMHGIDLGIPEKPEKE
jgi:hypothetical protein